MGDTTYCAIWGFAAQYFAILRHNHQLYQRADTSDDVQHGGAVDLSSLHFRYDDVARLYRKAADPLSLTYWPWTQRLRIVVSLCIAFGHAAEGEQQRDGP